MMQNSDAQIPPQIQNDTQDNMAPPEPSNLNTLGPEKCNVTKTQENLKMSFLKYVQVLMEH